MEENLLLASELCKNCGLCCSGALFGHATLEEGEETRAKELKINPVITEEGEGAFYLPCPHLDGTACSIYPERLQICGEYHCNLSTSVLEGETSFEEAIEDVNSAKEQAKWLKENAIYKDLDGKDEYKLSDYQAHFKDEYEKDQFNLRYYQNYFLYKLQVQLEEKPISQQDADYAAKTFDYIDLINRSFRETEMFQDYSELIKNIKNKMPD